MDINLKGKAPKARTLDEANEVIEALWDRLQHFIGKKKANSKNSSLPPSKDKSSKNKSNIRRNKQRRKHPKKPGGQPGHKKHERTLLSTDEVDSIVPCFPEAQCLCGGSIIQNKKIKRCHQQYEFPVIKPTVTEYQIFAGFCKSCNKKHTGRLPLGISWSMLGPRATAMTAHFSGTYRISKQNIVGLYQDCFGLKVSTGMICKAEKTVSRSLEYPVNEAKDFIQSANHTPVNADETGFKEKGKGMWAWIAIMQQVAIFMIRKPRSKQVAQELLSPDFKGILCSDRYSAYQWVPNNQRQICWAHLDRDFRKISERTGSSQIIGLDLLKQVDDLFHHWHRFKDGKLNRQTLKKKIKPIQTFIEGLLRRGRRSKNKHTAGTCSNILSYQSALWRFVEIEGVEPTNNLAEQMIRTLAIWRKTSFGTQSKGGTQYMERIMTIVATCKLQGKNILSYLTTAVKSFVSKAKPPSLLPEIKPNTELALVA